MIVYRIWKGNEIIFVLIVFLNIRLVVVEGIVIVYLWMLVGIIEILYVVLLVMFLLLILFKKWLMWCLSYIGEGKLLLFWYRF